MREVIAGWVGKSVSVTLHGQGLAMAVTLKGRLEHANDAGLLLQLAKGQTYVPLASILHVSLLDRNRE
jgi:hypothetical protein